MTSINIIDIEASGLDWDSYPIEIAVMVEKKLHTWLIQPQPKWLHWDENAECIHGISRDKLAKEGIQAAEVARELNTLLEESNGILYSDAAPWDADWIKTLFSSASIAPYFHVLPISDLFDDQQLLDFQSRFKILAESGEYRHHRAGPDVQMIDRAYQEVLDLK